MSPAYKTTICSSTLAAVLLLALTIPSLAAADGQTEAAGNSLLDLPLEQLVEVTVGGTLTETDPHRSPGNVTVITREDIAVTPARNLLDLIEIYVPSAMWLSHSAGPQIAMRGIVADRAYKYLVLVNGMRVNNGLLYGALSELSMWDLADIEKVEIIRGPGSVTYGPGAIAGVINITLKNARTAPGTEVSTFYWNRYIAKGFSVGSGLQGQDKEKDWDVYGYFSDTSVIGAAADIFGVLGTGTSGSNRVVSGSGAGAGSVAGGEAYYLGENSAVYSGAPASKFLHPFFGDPQVKAYAKVDFKNGWKFWTRYTSGNISTATGTDQQYRIDGEYTSFRTMRERQYLATLENTWKLNTDWVLVSTFNFTSTEMKNIYRYNSSAAENTQDNLRNITQWASENKWFNRLQFNYDPKTMWKAAFGTEFSYTVFGPGWGKDRNNGLRIDDMISGPGSEAYSATSTSNGYTGPASANYIPIGHGWKANQHAVFGELNFDLSDKWSLLLSGRIDKHSYTGYMVSPRGSLSYEFEPDHYLKFTAQRSVRMNTEDELFRNHYNGQRNTPEKLTTYEIMYQAYSQNGWDLMASTFYFENEAIAWNSVQRASTPVGELKAIGAEIEGAYRSRTFDFGANHSYVQQLKWTLDESIRTANSATSGISYGDYYLSTVYRVYGESSNRTVVLESTGNDLNNYSNHMTKFFSNIKLLSEKVTLHGDARILWGFPGGKDGLDMIRDAGGVTRSYAELKDKDAYGTLITANASLTLHLDKSTDLAVYVQNIPVYGDNKRYCYSSGSKTAAPERTQWIEEPLTVGARFTARF